MTELNFDSICELLRAQGIPAYVEQTGGGCATIYAGEPDRTDPDWPRFAAVAGPGWFEGPGWTNGRGDTGEFYVGPDDDGESEVIVPATSRWDEARAAKAIADLIALTRPGVKA